MKNWSVDENYLKKFPKKYKIWKLAQQINYGLDPGEKINRQELIKYWNEVSPQLDTQRLEFMNFILWR